jgi:outer membrane receptor protein involved in Fe transport
MDARAAYLLFPASGDYNTVKTAHDTADEDITMLGLTLTHEWDGVGTATIASSFANKRTDITTDFTGLLYLGGVVIGLPRAVGNEPGCVDPDDPMAVANFWNFPLICYPGAGTDGAFGMAHVQDTDMDLFTTEVRLASDLDGDWSYVVGGQGQRRTIDFYGAFEETDPDSGYIFEITPDNTRMFEREADFVMTSWAVYGEVSWNMTDSLTLTVGGRAFGTKKDEGGIIYGNMFEQPGILNPDPNDPDPDRRVMDIQYPVAQDRSFYDETASIFKGELSYRIGDGAMLYTTISQGYRSGGAINRVLVEMPSSFEHDETLNYELGAKTAWADGRFIANLSLFLVEFNDMQYRAPFQNDAFDAQLNCVDKCAESKGAELEMTWNATDNLSLYANFGWNENEILQNLYRPYEDDTLGYAALAGDPLSAQTPEETASAGIVYKFQMGKLDSFVRLDYQYTGGMERLNNDRSSDDPRPASDPLGEFSGTIADSELENEIPIPSWEAIHARAGIAGQNWSAELFVRNATDEIAAVHQQHVGVFLGDRTLAQPRTIGLQLKWFYE